MDIESEPELSESLIGKKVKMLDKEGIIVMTEGLNVYIHKDFELASKSPWITHKYVYTICVRIEDVVFID